MPSCTNREPTGHKWVESSISYGNTFKPKNSFFLFWNLIHVLQMSKNSIWLIWFMKNPCIFCEGNIEFLANVFVTNKNHLKFHWLTKILGCQMKRLKHYGSECYLNGILWFTKKFILKPKFRNYFSLQNLDYQ